MNKYTELSEFEINKAVAEKLGADDEYGTFTPLLKYSFDPCNNVEQAWEIMMKYNICVTKELNGEYVAFEWLVVNSVDDADWIYYATHEKPLVSAMLCFLEMDK